METSTFTLILRIFGALSFLIVIQNGGLSHFSVTSHEIHLKITMNMVLSQYDIVTIFMHDINFAETLPLVCDIHSNPY